MQGKAEKKIMTEKPKFPKGVKVLDKHNRKCYIEDYDWKEHLDMHEYLIVDEQGQKFIVREAYLTLIEEQGD